MIIAHCHRTKRGVQKSRITAIAVNSAAIKDDVGYKSTCLNWKNIVERMNCKTP